MPKVQNKLTLSKRDMDCLTNAKRIAGDVEDFLANTSSKEFGEALTAACDMKSNAETLLAYGPVYDLSTKPVQVAK